MYGNTTHYQEMIRASLKVNTRNHLRIGDTLLANFFEKSEEINRANGTSQGRTRTITKQRTVMVSKSLLILSCKG